MQCSARASTYLKLSSAPHWVPEYPAYSALRAMCRELAADEIAGALGQHEHGGVDVAADKIGKCRGVDDAQTVDAVHAQLGISDRHGVRGGFHAAGSHLVVRPPPP